MSTLVSQVDDRREAGDSASSLVNVEVCNECGDNIRRFAAACLADSDIVLVSVRVGVPDRSEDLSIDIDKSTDLVST